MYLESNCYGSFNNFFSNFSQTQLDVVLLALSFDKRKQVASRFMFIMKPVCIRRVVIHKIYVYSFFLSVQYLSKCICVYYTLIIKIEIYNYYRLV